MQKIILVLLLTMSISIGRTEPPKKLGMFDYTFDTRVLDYCVELLRFKRHQLLTPHQMADVTECSMDLKKEPEKPKYLGIHYTPIIYLNGY